MAKVLTGLGELPLTSTGTVVTTGFTVLTQDVVQSRVSERAPFYTIFDDFDLVATPHYNFFVDDETRNDRDPPGGRAVGDIPRYVHLVWDRAPRFPSSGQKVFDSSGLTFDLGSISDTFENVKGSVANGVVGPGTVTAVVEMPGDKFTTPEIVVDEGLFLASPDVVGLSIHDITSNVKTLSDGTAAAADVGTRSTTTDTRTALYDGGFSIVKTGGTLTVGSVRASSPALSFTAKTATVDLAPSTNQVLLLGETLAQPVKSDQTVASSQAVNFVDPAIVGLVSTTRVDLLQSPEHAETVVAFAQLLPDLVTLSAVKHDLPTVDTVPSSPAPAELAGVAYVGYVIEKYRRDAAGNFVFVREIDVPDPKTGELIDSEVLYGGIYRYRIRSVMGWTRPTNVDLMGVVAAEATKFGGTTPFAPNLTTYFVGGWCRRWAYAAVLDLVPPDPPDEVRVRPETHRGRVVVTWKLPADSQRDISGFLVLRRFQRIDGNDLKGWSRVGKFGPTNGLFVDIDVGTRQENGGVRYVYAVQTISRHGEFSALSDQIAASLNADFRFVGEDEAVWVSEAGVEVEQHGAFSVKPPRRSVVQPVARDIVGFTGRSGVMTSTAVDHVGRVVLESWDTGERREVDVSVVYRDLPPDVRRQVETIDVPVEAHETRPPNLAQDLGLLRGG